MRQMLPPATGLAIGLVISLVHRASGLQLGGGQSQKVCRWIEQRSHDAAIIFLVPGRRADGRLNMIKAAKDWDKALASLQSLKQISDNGRAEVRIFLDREDDVPEEDVSELINAVPASRDVCVVKIQFRQFPEGFSADQAESPQVRRTKWGYEHMIKFFFMGLFTTDVLQDLKYWMRMDADSTLRNPVNMDVFARLDDHPELAYLHNAANRDTGDIITGLCDFVGDYMKDRWSIEGDSNSTVPACRAPDSYVEGYFNNLEIGRVSAFQTEEVLNFMKSVDLSHGIYTHRWGDALLRRITIEMFGLGTEPVPDALMASYKHSWG